MSEKILVPVLGESITEATVAKWLKNKGDSVESDEPIVELETDKVNLEVPSPVDGVLSEINVNDGQVVEVGATLGVVTQGNVKTTKNEIIQSEQKIEKSEEQKERNYSLDRLGIPLVEIALEPVSTKPSGVKEIALTLGRLLRATRMVKRGIGSIRQDVNISVMNSGVVEVKGVQQLDQLEKIIGYEAKRQHGLIQIGDKLKKLSITITKEDVLDVTEIFKDCESKIIQKALKSEAKIKVIRIRNFSGMFGFEPYPGIRLGKEIGQIVRFFGIGGVFHSDELPNYGINDSDVGKVRKHLELADKDGFLIIAGEDSKLDYAVNSIVKRIQDAVNGVPAETRAATQDGETIFLRPRPGASRMYPETDIPSISVIPEEVKLARENIPKSWDESIAEIQQKYDLNSQLSEQIFDSEYTELFEKICENKKNSPNFVASILCSSITNLERKGFDGKLLKPKHIIESFELLASGKIPKESLEIIFENIMSGKSENVATAMQSTDISSMDEDELNGILDKIIQKNMELVKKLGDNAVTTMMGIAMKEVRGKASGKVVNDLLRKKISEL